MSTLFTRLIIFTLIATFWATISAAEPAPKPASSPDPVISDRELVALIRQVNEEKAKVDFLYLRKKKLSVVKKYLGVKTTPVAPKPTNGPQPGAVFAEPCPPTQRLFVRRDRLDTFQLGHEDAPSPGSNAKGASVSYTQDYLSHSNNVSVNGRVTYLLASYSPIPCDIANPYAPLDPNVSRLGYDIAPWIDAQGVLDTPRKKTDTNSLQAGFDAQIQVLGGPLFAHQYFIATPYYQTDFVGLARVEGIRAGWEPVAPEINLGARPIGVPDAYVDWFWQFRAEADVKHVGNVGLTGLTKSNYEWLGSTAQIHFNFFPGRADIEPTWEPPVPALVDRFYLNGMVQFYWNAANGKSIHLFEAELGYNLTSDKKSSISIKYDNGTDKDTLKAMKKYLIAINYKL